MLPAIIMFSQFLIGCGQGSEFPNSSAYVSEIMPKSVRSRMLVATITMQSVGGKAIGLGGTLALLAGLSGLAFVITAVLGKGLLSERAPS